MLKIKDINLTKDDIKTKINSYNKNYDNVITKQNILIRVASKCQSKTKHTII